MPTSISLSQLEKVDIRGVWTNEANDFTPWLAEEANIQLLGDTIGLELEVEAQEKDVGPFRADILCKDTITGNWVLVENQLERTDHCHLGQLITYAAGLKAVTIIWIASRFTDEHRAAVDWLNEITTGDFNFFGLEVEVWKIGESAAAPKFNLACAPNNWTQTVTQVKKNVEQGELTGAKQLQFEFWTSFREFVLDRGSVVKPTKPLPQAWMTVSIGRSGFALVAIAATQDTESATPDSHQLRVELVLSDEFAKNYFGQLEVSKAVIEANFDGPLIWAETPNKKQSKIYVKRSANFDDRAEWPAYHEWLLKNLEKFTAVFAKRVKTLTAIPSEAALN
ncbi:MAG: DUF4268 domain-containing protein [Planctomycetes bacterium]|nr:DUF4268 domain-containing protein [Planctomycetota bacterium]